MAVITILMATTRKTFRLLLRPNGVFRAACGRRINTFTKPGTTVVVCDSSVFTTTISCPSWRTLATLNTGAPEEIIDSPLDHVTYERVCAETMDTLSDYFEELTENAPNITGSDVAYGDGVLTVNLGKDYGTYVINRQTPNKQIWLSSPKSGPKRYDFVGPKDAAYGKWIYKHTGQSIHELLQHEMEAIMKPQKVNFLQLPYGN